MKLARTHLGSLVGILAIFAGVTAVACSAPPPGAIGYGDQDQADGDDDDDGKLPKSSTSPTNPSNPSNGTQQPSTNDPGTTPAPTPPNVDASTPPPPPSAGTCSASADMWTCFDCCDAAHPGGWEVAAQAFDQCACTQACAGVCGSNYCAGGEPTDSCIQCLDNNAQQCEAAADAACAGNANCAAADACAQASQCEAKPDQ